MKHITDPAELEIGRDYWLVAKAKAMTSWNPRVSRLLDDNGRKFFEFRMWVEPDNNQAMEYWDIFGPLPIPAEPDFEALKRAKATGMAEEDIDRKYSINAVNPCSGNVHTERDSVLFLAKDKAFLEGGLPGYRAKCIELGANPAHIESIDLLTERVRKFQENIESKVPETDLPCEIRRCIDGEGL